MESIKTPLKINYVVHATVIRVEKRKRQFYVSGVGKDAIFHDQDLGYWMLLTGSHEAIYIGEEQPRIQEGDEIKITFEKVDPCPPSQTTNPTT